MDPTVPKQNLANFWRMLMRFRIPATPLLALGFAWAHPGNAAPAPEAPPQPQNAVQNAVHSEAPTTSAATLAPVVVTATRVQQNAFEIPASIDAVSATALDRNKLGISLAESLNAVPGVLVRDRLDYAQDQQVSVRGFGARAQFGIVGVRLYVDGVPATMPDGAGQASHFNLNSADRIEILRGPFSSLYGNAAGGVIQIFTADGAAPPELGVEGVGGSFGTWRSSITGSGTAGKLDYTADYTHFSTDGYRDHSRARRDSGNAKFGYQLAQGNHLTLVTNTVSIPEAQDEGALTRGQFDATPSQAAPSAIQYNTRKSTEQTQIGLIDEQALSSTQSLRLTTYYGHRIVKQFQSITTGAQSNPLSPGGVIDLHNGYFGGDLRWTDKTQLFGRALTLVAGVDYDRLESHRRGYENYIGTTLGVQGALRRDEQDTLYNIDEYLQADWRIAQRWSLVAGVRHSQVDIDSNDYYITDSNPNDSGAVAFSATLPVVGVMFRASDQVHFYADYGQGLDTPTFDNLAYQPNGASGLNFALQPARTGTGEIGTKVRFNARNQMNVAYFRSITRDEIVVATAGGGRSTYQNAGRTRRQGAEMEFDTALSDRWHWQLAYTYLDAIYRQSYLTCTSRSCTTPTTTVPAGNRITGIPQSSLNTALRWGRDTGFNAALEVSYLSNLEVNDVNTAGAPAYGLVGLNGGYVWDLPKMRIKSFVRVDNLAGTNYVGAIVVNDSNGQYFQPGSSRAAYAGMSLTWKDPRL